MVLNYFRLLLKFIHAKKRKEERIYCKLTPPLPKKRNAAWKSGVLEIYATAVFKI